MEVAVAKKSKYEGPQAALVLYEAVVAAHPNVERKGARNPYTSLNGHMFSFLDASGAMALRLSSEDQTEFVARYGTAPVEQHGRIMKDYVAIPDELLSDTEQLGPWFVRSHAYLETLKPKPTKRG